MIKTALACANGTVPGEVAGLAARRALAQLPDPQLAFLVAPVVLDQKILFETLRRDLKGIPIFGVSSPFAISTRGVEAGSVVLLLLRSDDLQFRLYSGKTGENPAEISRYLFSRFLFDQPLGAEDLVTCILTGTEIHSRGIEYLTGARELLPRPLPIIGGCAVGTYPSDDLLAINSGFQYCGNLVGQDMLNLLFLKALDPQKTGFGYAYESSWSPVAHPVVCTRTQGNTVHEVDGRPIRQYLTEFLGPDHQSLLLAHRPRFSFIGRLRDGPIEKAVIRAPIVDRSAPEVLSFWPIEEMQGQEIQLVQMARDDLLVGATAAANRAREALGSKRPAAVFVFSCAVRHKVLNTWAEREVTAIREVFGPTVPIIGLYAGAEFAPLYNKHEDVIDSRRALAGSRQLGASVAIFALGTSEPEGNERQYVQLLEGFVKEDRAGRSIEEAERISRLQAVLEDTEGRLLETERSLGTIIQQHYQTTVSLQKKNAELAEANRRNERLKNVIRQYTPHTVWDKASVSVFAGLYKIPDEEIFATFMFLDVKGFTSFAEKNPPDRVIAELNQIFQPATEFIYGNGGDIDKFIGDAIFARFEDPGKALTAALAIQTLIREKQAGGCPFAVRIGLHHGRVVSGNVGAETRRENALIGDAVNLTQRLEANATPGSILVSQVFLEHLDKALLTGLTTRESTIKVKGKEETIPVLEITLPVREPAAG